MTARRFFFRRLFNGAALATAIASAGLGATAVQAQTAAASTSKVSTDLAQVLPMTSQPAVPWAFWSSEKATLFVRVIVVSSADDAQLADMRRAVLAGGGSVNYVFASVRAMMAMVPARLVPQLAARADVQSIVPNRPAARTASVRAREKGGRRARSSRRGRGDGACRSASRGNRRSRRRASVRRLHHPCRA